MKGSDGSEAAASALVGEAVTALGAVPRFAGDELYRAAILALCESYQTMPGHARGGAAKEIRESFAALRAAVPVGAVVDRQDELKAKRAARARAAEG